MITRLRADNPGPLSLSGTNTWIVGRDPAWIVDPGPSLPAHEAAILEEVGRRGGAGGIALTHDHFDHKESVPALRERLGVPVGAYHDADVILRDGDTFGPFTVYELPGHADDHLVFVAGRAAFTGDAVLGEGSVFVSAQLGAYLDGLRRLRALDLEGIHPGHGEPVSDPAAKLDEYLAHRLEREEKLVAALDAGVRDEDGLLDAAWADAPAAVRPYAAITMRAHLQKLKEEGRFSG